MKKIIFIAFIVLNLKVSAQEKKCSDYRNGKFTFEDPAFTNWRVIRNGTEQIQIDDLNQIEIYGSIEWISDCEYILTYTKINIPEWNSIIGQKVNIKIIEVKTNSIIVHSKALGNEMEVEMVLEK